MRRLIVASLALALIGASGVAHADEPAVKETPASGERWYGVQTLAVDGAAAALFALGYATTDSVQPVLSAAAFGVYGFGTPIVHVVHGRPLRALGDVGFRIVSPLLTTMAGYFIAGGGTNGKTAEDPSVNTAMTIGFAAGAVTAIAFDALWLARGDAPKAETSAKSDTTFTPGIAPTKNGVAAGLTGTF